MPTEPVEKSAGTGSFRRDGYDCRPPNSRSVVRYDGSSCPSRYSIAWRTGEACGLTETRPGARRCSNQSAVMIETIDADDD
jgi:hypothetical protein